MKRKTLLCFWLCWFISLSLNAEPQLFNHNITEFSVMPELCVLPKDAAHCETQLKVEWTAKHPMQLCLRVYYMLSKKPVRPLHCWHEETENANMSIPANLKHSIILELVERSELNDVDARAEFKLYKAKSTSLRKRNPWDFF